jgi:hypothetical protein
MRLQVLRRIGEPAVRRAVHELHDAAVAVSRVREGSVAGLAAACDAGDGFAGWFATVEIRSTFMSSSDVSMRPFGVTWS